MIETLFGEVFNAYNSRTGYTKIKYTATGPPKCTVQWRKDSKHLQASVISATLELNPCAVGAKMGSQSRMTRAGGKVRGGRVLGKNGEEKWG